MARLRLCCLVLFDPFSSRLIAISSVFLPFCPSVLRRACICPAENTKRTKIGILTDLFPFFQIWYFPHIILCCIIVPNLFEVGKYFNSEQELLLLECDRGGESKWSESVLQGEEGRIWFPSKINDHSWSWRYRISNYLRHCCLIWNVRLFYHFIKGNIASKFTNFFWGLYIQQHDVICSSPSSSKTSQPAG